MYGILIDLLIGGVGCLAVVILALAGVFRRLHPRGRVILGASLSAGLALLLIVAVLATQLGAIRTTLARQASPSHATLVALSADLSGRETLSALSGHDGSLLWRRALGLYLVEGRLVGSTVYIVGFAQPNQTRATLLALRLSDGATLWQEPLPELQAPSRLLVAGGLLITMAQTSVSPPSTELVAIGLSAHSVAWQATLTSPPSTYYVGALATGDGLLFLGSQDGMARALRLSDGSPVWSVRISPQMTAVTPVISLWVVAHGDTLIAYDTTSEVVSLRPGDGATRWGRRLFPLPYSVYDEQMTLTGDGLYLCGVDPVTHQRALVSLDPLTGATRWSRDAACAQSQPVEAGAYLYALNGTLLNVRRVSDGALVWQSAPSQKDLGYTSPLGDAGVLFAATDIANYRNFSVCGQWFPPQVSLCHSTQYIAAFDGATGAEYWRTTDSYGSLLGLD